MSDETEQRMCDEDFGSDEEGEEADVESYLEDNSSELMDRLRELEAENSALMLANESQREAYERCLDEVANHVVQALLNQKDLREECIKLKMLVFDLERQNRALCELFQQKLPNNPTAHYQVNEQQTILYNHSENTVTPPRLQCTAGNGYRTQHASPGPRGSAASMEALSPFFKKKAHILEVLRKMEETDPLKFHPSTTSLSFCDYSQVLMSTETVLATADPLPLQCKAHHTHCRCSCSDSDTHQHVNGEGAVKCEGGNTCCLHCKRSPDGPPKPCNHVCSPPKANSTTQSHVVPTAAMSECHSKSTTVESVPPSKQSIKNDNHQQTAGAAPHSSITETANQSSEVLGAEQEEAAAESCPKASASEELTGFYPASHLPILMKDSTLAHCDMETREAIHNGLMLSSLNSSVSADPSAVPEKDDTDQEASCVRANASLSPSPSCLSDVKAAAINSPSKLLKFLKIPSIGEKSQASTSPVRLSPQLTRNSRIPCRTNNYEVYHSPVPTRRATTTERCRQPPPPPSRSESYPLGPATSSSSSPKVSQRVPHYENVSDMSTNSREEEEPPQGLEKRTTLPSHTKVSGGERKLVKSLPESVLNPPPQRKQSSETAMQSSEVAQAAPPPLAKRSDPSSIPKRPGTGPGRSPADSSHHAFKDRLAALGKLRSSEDLQVSLRPVDAANTNTQCNESNITYSDERSKTAERSTEHHKEEQRHSKYTDSLDGKPKSSSGGLKYPGSSQLYEPGLKSLPSGPAVVKPELCVTKTESPKSKIGLPSPNADAPQVLRNNMKCPGSLNLAYSAKPGLGPHSSNSPNRVPPKSPSKPCQPPSIHKGGKPDAPRYSSKSEERSKISGKGKKNPMYGDSLPPPPPRPPTSDSQEDKVPHVVPVPQSAIEQKVMKGIEENVLKLQEQDRGGQGAEVKQKASNGIASWFGLKKSKLPALSRKTDATKAKDEKREWKINIPSVGKDSVKMATRCKEGVEGLNISTLMEKAEGLRRALEEERAYVERSGRGHSCEVVMDQAQGQLAVMYRGARGLSASSPCGVTGSPCLFSPGSGASTYTLDSGIGTFPLPDCSSGATGRSLSKTRAGADHHASGSPGKAGRRARTLDREITSQEECYAPHRQLIPTIQYGSMLEGRSTTGVIREGDNNQFEPHLVIQTPSIKSLLLYHRHRLQTLHCTQ
uniref:NCK-associated protein 5-like n=1 Tax=Myripristis murdjan TaxID=586833 RepID=A0A667YJV2_9TELE